MLSEVLLPYTQLRTKQNHFVFSLIANKLRFVNFALSEPVTINFQHVCMFTNRGYLVRTELCHILFLSVGGLYGHLKHILIKFTTINST